MNKAEFYHHLLESDDSLIELLKGIPKYANFGGYRDFIAENRDNDYQMMVPSEPGYQAGKLKITEKIRKRLGVAWLYLDSHTFFSENGLELTEKHYDMIRREQVLKSN